MRRYRMRKSGVSTRRVAAAIVPLLVAGALVSLPTSSPAASPAAVPDPESALPVPTPTLTPVDVPDTIMGGASAVDLAAAGYTEKEYYVTGSANRYTSTGALTTSTPTPGGPHPYKTRVIVRAPADPAKFNGTLVVEWNNVTIGIDGEFVYAEVNEKMLEDGYAFAAVSVQRVGVNHLRNWEPARYGDLNVDANVCGDEGSSLCTGDPLGWDIYTQTAKALKANPGGAYLPDLNVQHVIATGQSQSASRLTLYYNNIHPLYNLFDAFVYHDAAGQLRADEATPAISVNTDGCSGCFPSAWTTSEYTRTWEVAGTTHASYFGQQYMDAVYNRDRALLDGAGQVINFTQWILPSCVLTPPFTMVDLGQVLNTAFESVDDWLVAGTPAPPSMYFSRADNVVQRDAAGVALGGVRLAEVSAPTRHFQPLNGTAFPCNVSGYHRDYTPAELKALYPSHDAYVQQVTDATRAAMAAGYLLPGDAQATIEAARASNVGFRDSLVAAATSSSTHAYGTASSVSVQVTSPDGVPSGKVSVVERGDVIGTGTLDGTGSATIAISGTALSPGAHTLRISYLGNGTYSPSSTQVRTTVTKVTTTTTARAKTTELRKGQRGKIVVNVSPAALLGGGRVTVKERSKTVVARVRIDGSNGRVVVRLPKLKRGRHAFVVTYSGSEQAWASRSNTVTIRSAG